MTLSKFLSESAVMYDKRSLSDCGTCRQLCNLGEICFVPYLTLRAFNVCIESLSCRFLLFHLLYIGLFFFSGLVSFQIRQWLCFLGKTIYFDVVLPLLSFSVGMRFDWFAPSAQTSSRTIFVYIEQHFSFLVRRCCTYSLATRPFCWKICMCTPTNAIFSLLSNCLDRNFTMAEYIINHAFEVLVVSANSVNRALITD